MIPLSIGFWGQGIQWDNYFRNQRLTLTSEVILRSFKVIFGYIFGFSAFFGTFTESKHIIEDIFKFYMISFFQMMVKILFLGPFFNILWTSILYILCPVNIHMTDKFTVLNSNLKIVQKTSHKRKIHIYSRI